MALLPPSATISPFHLRKGEGGTGTFFYTRKKKKKKLSFLLWWWFDRIFSLFGSSGTEVLFFTDTHMYSHTYKHKHNTLGITGCPGPNHLES